MKDKHLLPAQRTLLPHRRPTLLKVLILASVGATLLAGMSLIWELAQLPADPAVLESTAAKAKTSHFINRMTATWSSSYLIDSTSSKLFWLPARANKIPRTIFFVHYNQQLKNPKYLCAVESAARRNPYHKVAVHVANQSLFDDSAALWRKKLPAYLRKRILTVPLNWTTSFADTPLETWYQSGAYNISKWVDQNLGNAFRLAQLYKEGGVYMDLDILSINTVAAMGRSLVYEEEGVLNNAYLSMEMHDEFVWEMMKEFTSSWHGWIWGHNGPKMVTRTYAKLCQTEQPHRACNNLALAPHKRMFAVQFPRRGDLYDAFETQPDLLALLADEAVGLHYWNKCTQSTPMSDKTMLAVTMKLACPSVFQAFGDKELGISPDGVLGAEEYFKMEYFDM